MTITIPLTVQLDYTELKFALRSIEKYIQKPYEVLIIGDDIPEWITNIVHINLPDIRGKKQLSIRRKILAALEYTEEILFLNDDQYFLQPWDTFPYYWHGMLKHYSESGSRPVEKTLIELSKPVKHFDGHMPIIYKQDFKEASQHFSEECIIKSMYCNYHEIEGTFMPDCKPKSGKDIELFIKDMPCFSTGFASLNNALPILQKLFPDKSTFEA